MENAKAPAPVAEAIESLKAGEKTATARAHQLLQEAVLGRRGCLRTDIPRKVDWAESAWGEFVALLRHDNNHVRCIAGQMLSNLSQSANPKTALRDLDKVVAVTHDKMFVTARHVLQALWKFGLGDDELREALVVRLANRFEESSAEKNSTLIRFDISVGLRALYDAIGEEAVMAAADRLIPLETDPKYKKKYAKIWGGLDRDSIERSQTTSYRSIG